MRQIHKSIAVLAAAALAVSCGNRGGKADVKPQEEAKTPLVEVYSANYQTAVSYTHLTLPTI